VSGGAKGIGAGVVERLLADGLGVVAIDTDQSELDQLAEQLGDLSARLRCVVGDVTDPSTWREAVAVCEDSYGPATVLVNNAGISPKTDGVKLDGVDVPLSEWQRVLDVNLTGPFLGTQAVIPGMIQAGWGRVVNMSSQAGRTSTVVAGVHYGATKTGVLGLTRAFAKELAASRITVNAVAPGKIETPMMQGAVPEANERFLTSIPVGYFGQPADIAAVVSFLVSAEAHFITGATIDANGGSYMG
jgi:3-oxoacyl-[acyl-carrier protein] reductase